MALRVLGSGFGRTGTMTMKVALEQLGFGPTHHMIEVAQNPIQQALWKTAFQGQDVDWADAFDGFGSQVDFPGAAYWRETMIAFPEAKIIHTERPEEEWWASFDSTIGKSLRMNDDLPIPIELKSLFGAVRDDLMAKVFGDFSDRSSAIAAYRENNRKVREIIPVQRLLVFNVADGWEPLCRFLNVKAPDAPFPYYHLRSEFWEHFGGEPLAA